ncbi:hypothetical protein M2318_000393 [Metapseudomonas resinovorans]|uniref:hypothetical protein n=1 Tax=Metapseudomonas resinovorans TaxID=53412 RepID=UPI003D249833
MSLALVLVANTNRKESKQIEVQAAPEFLKLHKHLQQVFPLVHRTLKRELVGGYSLLCT